MQRQQVLREEADIVYTLSAAEYEILKKLIHRETGPNPMPPGMGFRELAEFFGLESAVYRDQED